MLGGLPTGVTAPGFASHETRCAFGESANMGTNHLPVVTVSHEAPTAVRQTAAKLARAQKRHHAARETVRIITEDDIFAGRHGETLGTLCGRHHRRPERHSLQ